MAKRKATAEEALDMIMGSDNNGGSDGEVSSGYTLDTESDWSSDILLKMKCLS